MIKIIITLLVIINLPIFIAMFMKSSTKLYCGETHGHRLHRRIRE